MHQNRCTHESKTKFPALFLISKQKFESSGTSFDSDAVSQIFTSIYIYINQTISPSSILPALHKNNKHNKHTQQQQQSHNNRKFRLITRFVQ